MSNLLGVIENLVRNAAGAGARTIEVRTAADGDDLVLQVSDDGRGIPEELLDEIFEPFVTHGKKEGTGLGLAIAKDVCIRHGFELTFGAPEEGGLEVVMTGPLRDGTS